MGKKANLLPQDLKKMMEEKTVKVIDVRTPEEYEEGHIKGAQLINVYDSFFASELEELRKDQVYVLYCSTGERSGSAGNLMLDKGFEQVYNLQGGITQWDQEGYETVS